ncbi:yippee-like protein [Fimicolochytrium jonesii]|uniref:yippee-like protein n=1 Tax=Fimicolochytrium jonesii TaxID=1396493 RepID=UPI0022FEF4EF|nr:yippee-like protein [Fimicolochytrium jonesii]KAI8826175.1 yippee-like protein [Fimicolochytrium jonesii]
MGIIFKRYLDTPTHNNSRIFGCSECKTHMATTEDIVSKAFQGTTGRAYLLQSVVNVIEGDLRTATMTTGVHTVKDIFCTACQTLVGWKYEHAHEDSQKYKEGKFILERQLVCEVI